MFSPSSDINPCHSLFFVGIICRPIWESLRSGIICVPEIICGPIRSPLSLCHWISYFIIIVRLSVSASLLMCISVSIKVGSGIFTIGVAYPISI